MPSSDRRSLDVGGMTVHGVAFPVRRAHVVRAVVGVLSCACEFETVVAGTTVERVGPERASQKIVPGAAVEPAPRPVPVGGGD